MHAHVKTIDDVTWVFVVPPKTAGRLEMAQAWLFFSP